ncbi:MAG TPA: ABC transporter substrate-binding protein [Chloroflexia bacterium]|jgi:glucose/mannose transport system substrate-binding protein|nr:ABC transporter substrate-binding protein [Chloroflexia bacterium]
MNRKRTLWLMSLLAVVAMLLTACGGETPTATAVPAAGSSGGGQTAAGGGKLEMFSWWTTGGEEAGLKAMYALYKKDHPNVEIVNQAVAGAAGADAKAVLKNRMIGGDPPDAFQVHMGHELLDGYVAAGQVEPLDDLYKSEGFDKAFPKGVLDIVSGDGHFWSVPVNIHRANVLWYNKKVFADNNLTAPVSFDDFFKAADALKAKGITALALGDKVPFASAHLFETVLVGTLGPDGYKGLWTGATKWDDPKVTDALNTFKKMLGYINSDHAALTWDGANDLVISGKAGMTIMGDWTDADYKAKKFTDYGWTNSPGTAGIYDALSDTFALPKNAKDRDNALAWLKLAGSREGQDAFNPLKGSIPARTDAGQGDYDAYLKSAMEDWKKDTIVPSVVHGAAAKDGWAQSYTDAINSFVTNQDVAATQKALGQACVDAGICK